MVTVAGFDRAERPRERLLEKGPEALSDAELLAVLLGTGTREAGVLEFAERWLADAGGLEGLAAADRRWLLKRKGIGAIDMLVITAEGSQGFSKDLPGLK